ncbi:MAG: hypothetical protein ACJZ8O_06635 [Pirellulaceae bacterium]
MHIAPPEQSQGHISASRKFFWFVIACLVLLSGVRMAGTRAKDSQHDDHESMMLSANDRSRWAMIYSMVEHGSFSIDQVIQDDRRWNTIDKVVHRGQDGELHQYSSKPPLFPMLLAADYWVISKVTGMSFPEDTVAVQWIILLITNLLPLIGFVWLVYLITSQLTTDNWTLRYLIAAAAFGTFLTGFVTTLNNHLPAAISVLISIYAVIQIQGRKRLDARWFALAGGFGAFAVVNELPSLSFFASIIGWLLLYHFRRTLKITIPAAGAVAIAFLGTNYWAHGSLRPPYAHRSDGDIAGVVDGFFDEHKLTMGVASKEIRTLISDAVDTQLTPELEFVFHKSDSRRLVMLDEAANLQYAVKAKGNSLIIREWDNWYDYPGSYWLDGNRRGIDIGEPSRAAYLLHMTVGHHGVFSLTPLWILSLLGCVYLLKYGETTLKQLATMTLLLTIVCIAFYLMRPMLDRNYGGVASGFRWMFWLAPLYLITMIPTVTKWSRTRVGQGALISILAASAFSALWGFYNPWIYPWTYAA